VSTANDLEQRLFATRVSAATGLDYGVVYAWTKAEAGPGGNPLNLRPGTSYGDWRKAADVVIRQLHSPDFGYPAILRSSSQGPQAQIAAIAASRWDACHYRGTHPDGSCVNASIGSLLRGVYARVKGASKATDPTAPFPHVLPDIPNPVKPVTDVAHAIADLPGEIEGGVVRAGGWVLSKAELGLVYVLLTAAAFALVLLGLLRAFGTSPRQLIPARAVAGAQTAEIPF
jgi:hypothetical protein